MVTMEEGMISDLVLDDEHATVGVDDSVIEGTKRLLDLPGGVLIVLGDDDKVKGVLGTNQILKAIADGQDITSTSCGDHMELDVMEVRLEASISEVLPEINERKPIAVVAVDEDGGFAGYFSPNDYRQALTRVNDKPAIRALE